MSSVTGVIRDDLFALRDEAYCEFQKKLITTTAPEGMIGVRTPALRKYAKDLSLKPELCREFLSELPHRFFDEDQLHAFVISGMKDYEKAVEETCRFLPFVDNWATCDQMSPKIFKKHRKELLPKINEWIGSGKTYVVRFGIGMLMEHFLDEDFDVSYLETVSAVKTDEYYVNMMIAWYFATALAKQYDDAVVYIEKQRLAPWTHNKAIQKAVESYRVTDEHKAYLRGFKVKT